MIHDYIGEPLYMDYIDDYIGNYHNPLLGNPFFYQPVETTEGFENSSTVILLEASLGWNWHSTMGASAKTGFWILYIWVCLKIGYIPNYSHLIRIMIINHWV